MNKRIALVAVVIAAGLSGGFFLSLARPESGDDPRPRRSGWGLDAIFARHLRPEQRPVFLELVRETDIRYLRERSHGDLRDPAIWKTGELATYAALRGNGYGVVAFATLPGRPRGERYLNHLREDLLSVYSAARELGRTTGYLVAAWELPNEPDVHYVKDLPDRFAAYSKALYLGLRDGAAASSRSRPPAVLMGALGNFSGPWLQRAAENGLFDYTDGLNVHFYGHARDLRGAIRAHRNTAAEWVQDRTLPMWITECGINAVPFDQPEELRGREIQRAFTVETARTALEDDVAVFMPFVMNHRRNPFWSLIRDTGDPYPAWTDYAEFTQNHSLKDQPVVARPVAPNRLVVQWLPDNGTALPHKVSGTYRFRGGAQDPRPIRGAWRVYNFSEVPVVGRLEVAGEEGRVSMGPQLRRGSHRGERPKAASGEIEGKDYLLGEGVSVGPFSMVEFPVEVRTVGPGYVREAMVATFSPVVSRPGQRGSKAVVSFETVPGREVLQVVEKLEGTQPTLGEIEWIWAPEPPVDVTRGGVWLGLNGVEVRENEKNLSGSLDSTSRFVVAGESTDPRLPPTAITKLDGLPEGDDAFLRLRYLKGSSSAGGIRVDLVDDLGQRFSVAENLGRSWYRSRPNEVLFSYQDFNLYAFGRISERPVFRPEAIREIQLRFYPVVQLADYRVRLDVVKAGEWDR